MAIINGAPIRIDASAVQNSRASTFANNVSAYFEFSFNGSVYAILADNFRNQIGVWKTTDQGANWTRLDTSHEPSGSGVRSFVSAIDPVNGIIYAAHAVSSPNTVVMERFYCAGGTPGGDVWASPVSGATEFLGSPQLAFLSTGVVRLIWAVSGSGDLDKRDFSSGSWGSTSTVATLGTGSNTIRSLVVDSSNRSWLSIEVHDAGVSAQTLYIDSGGTASSPSTVTTGTGFWGGNGVIDGDSVEFPYIAAGSLAPDKNLPQIMRGTPLSSPSWSLELVDSGLVAPQDFADYPSMFLDKDGAPTYLWVVVDQSTADPDQLWINKRIAGVWGTPQLFYDAAANPPVGGVATIDQFIHTDSGIQFADGQYLVITALETVDDEDVPSCTGFALIDPAGASASLSFGIGLSVNLTPPIPVSLSFGLGLHAGLGTPNLKLVKIVSNTHGGSALPTDFTLNAAGPTPISGRGTVGPTPVAPGTYVLSESGPAGYTAGQWSCTGATMVGNQVTIPAGATVVCTIVNSDTGGAGPTPTPPTPNPQPCPEDPIAPATFHAAPAGVAGTAQAEPTVVIYVSQEPQEPVGP